ncbi:uncharacterized protein LOC131433053 [Malaya genurostris]|uniref:uncharacterized protein LOC131433053 n=1 Tax=Malaya genurostris TaxID=325434 RepID=UPI0026F40A01|nr:uncharacterized protein LOC131433053 [Malaya genurostris]
MNPIVWVCVFLFCAVFVFPFWKVNAKANYQISIDGFETNPNSDPAFVDYGDVHPSQKARNVFLIGGNFELFKDVDNSYKASYEVFLGENKKPMFTGSSGACELLDNDHKIMQRLRQVSNFPERGVCPMTSGKYKIDNYEVEESQLPAILPKGKYKLVLVVKKDDTVKAGFTIHVTVK